MKLAKILDAIKRVAGFPAELRLQHTQQQAEQLRADADVLDAEAHLAEGSRAPSQTPAARCGLGSAARRYHG